MFAGIGDQTTIAYVPRVLTVVLFLKRGACSQSLAHHALKIIPIYMVYAVVYNVPNGDGRVCLVSALDEEHAEKLAVSYVAKEASCEIGEVSVWSVDDAFDILGVEVKETGDEIAEQGFCPHCDIALVSRMIDVDGTNLVERDVCEKCGYGTPALM